MNGRPRGALFAGSLLAVACASAPRAEGDLHQTATPVTIPSALPSAAVTPTAGVPQPTAPLPAFSLLFQGYAGVAFDLVGPSVMIRHFNVGWSNAFRYDGATVTDASALTKGLGVTPRDPKPWVVIDGFSGTYPDALQVDFQLRVGRQFNGSRATRKNGKWVYLSWGAGGAEYQRAANADKIIWQTPLPNGEAVYEAIENGKIALAVERDGVVVRRLAASSEGAAAGCATTIVQHDALFGTKDGAVVGFGALCRGADDHPKPGPRSAGVQAVERWEKGATTGAVSLLPATSRCTWSLLEVEGGSLWASCGDKVALFDGKSWREVQYPAVGPRWAMGAQAAQVVIGSEATFRWNGKWERIAGAPGGAPDWAAVREGAVWAVRKGALFRLLPGAADYQEVPLALADGKPVRAHEAGWSDAGEMLVLAGDHLPHLVLSDRYRGAPFVVSEPKTP